MMSEESDGFAVVWGSETRQSRLLPVEEAPQAVNNEQVVVAKYYCS